MLKLKLIANTLAVSLIPFVDVVAAFARVDRVKAIKIIVACEVVEAVVIAGIFFGLGLVF